MRGKIIFGVLLILMQIVSLEGISQLITNFPYENSLKGSSTSTPQHIVGVGSSVTFNETGAQLTPAEGNKSGAIILNGASFNSTNGLIIEFEYDMFGGSHTNLTTFGDGLSFFLYDATATTDNLLGANGAGLGYTYNRSGSSGSRVNGLNKAYLGVALDQYGNHKGRRFQGDSYVSGLNSGGVTWANSGISHVTLRGAMSKSAISTISGETSENTNPRFAGYPVLYTQSTIASSGSTGAFMDMANNSLSNVSYTVSNEIISNQFELRGGVSNPLSNNSGYRKAIVELQPANPAIGGGFFITVKIQHGLTITTVINQYHYRTSFYFRENANRSGSSATDNTNHLLNASIPIEMKLGFSASTGGASQAHVIRNLKVSLPFQPVFVEDKVEMCTNMTRNVSFSVFPNDLMYNGVLYNNPTAGATNAFIDFNSFRFENSTGSVLGLPTTYTNPDQGTWNYNPDTGEVTFTPKPGFKGLATVYYSAKGTASQGGPFSQEIYRSTPTKLTVNVAQCGGVINPHIPSGGVSRSGR